MKVRFLAATSLLGMLGACLDQPFATNVDLPLQVLQLAPTDGAVDVARAAAITATFNLPVVETSLAGNFVVENITDPAAPLAVEGTLTYVAPDGDAAPRAVFQPTALLPYSTPFRVTLSTGIGRDTEPAGNLLRPAISTFTTEDPPPLSVISVVPGAGATGVDPTTTIAITFSEPVRCATVEAGLSVTQTFDAQSDTTPGQTAPVTGTLACVEPASIEETGCDNGACTVTFTQSAPPLDLSAIVTISLAGGSRADGAVESFRATDVGGQFPADFTSTFTVLDPEPLVLLSATPGNGSTQVPLDSELVLTFWEDLDCATFTADDVTVLQTLDDGSTGPAVTASVASCVGATVTLTFSRPFEHSATIDVTLGSSIASARATSRGGQLEGGGLVTFTAEDPPPLFVLQSNPGNGSTGVGFTTDLTLDFSEAVDCNTVDAAVATTVVEEVFTAEVAALRGAPGTTHTVVVRSCADDVAVYDIVGDFDLASTVTVTLPGTIASSRATLSGGQLNAGAPHVIVFEVIPFPPVEIVDIQPPGPQILANTSFTVTFNQDIFVPVVDRLSPEVDVFLAELANPGDVPDVANAVEITCVNCTQGDTYTFAPVAPLTAGATYVLVIRGGPAGVFGAAGGSIALGDFLQRYLVVGGSLLIATDPIDGDTDVPVTSTVCATFLIDVGDLINGDPEGDAFVVSAENDLGGQTALPGTLAFSGVDPLTGLPDPAFDSNSVCFTPTPSSIPCRENDELLPANTLITMTLSFIDGITDPESPQVVSESRSFTTGGLPTLIDSFYETVPAVNLTGELTTEVPVNGTFVLVFDSAVDDATLAAVRLETAGGAAVATTVTRDPADETMVRIGPNALLAFASSFRIEVDGGVSAGLRFVDGRYLADDIAISFVTSPPNSATISPIAGENAVETTVTPIVFGRAMFLPSLNTDSIVARDNTQALVIGGAVATAVDDAFSAVFNPLPTYVAGNSVTLTVNTGALDFLGNPLPAPVSVTWASIGGAPAANARVPGAIAAGNVAPNAGTVAATQTFVVTMGTNNANQLENRVLPASFNENSVRFEQTAACALGGAAHVIATVNRLTPAAVPLAGDVIRVAPQEFLRSGCSYRLTLRQRFFSNIHTISNDAAADVVINVTGEAVRPTRVSGNVSNSAGGAPLVVTFSEPIDLPTLSAATVSDGTGAVPGAFTTSGNTVVFTPATFWRTGLTYTATFPTSVADLAGNTLAAQQTVTLTTETTAPVAPTTATTVGDSLVLTFNEALDPVSVVPSTFGAGGSAGTVLVREAGNGTSVDACVTAIGATIVVDHIAVAAGTALEIVVTTEVKDEAGNAVAADRVIAATAP